VKVKEEFVIAESPQALWEFFEQLDQVARCVPGVEEVTVLDADNSRVRVTQALGPMTATFDVKMRITERDPGRSMQFTAVGRSVRGAAGNVRATHIVRLQDEDEGSTRVLLEGDLALGGMLGSVGQKVVAKQASVVTRSFAQALQERLSDGSAAGPPSPSPNASPSPEQSAADEPEPSSAARRPEPSSGLPPPGRGGSGNLAGVALAAGIALSVLLFAIRRLRSRSRSGSG
jgi:uncharacterized protein